MNSLQELKIELKQQANAEKALIYKSFFKTAPGQYGEGDIFVGVTSPILHKIAKSYQDLSLEDCSELLSSSIHEERMLAVFILTEQFQKAKKELFKKEIIDCYLKNIKGINSWDLVDLSAPKLLGPYLWEKNKQLLYEWAKTEDLWKQRIAIISTFYFIRKKSYSDALAIADILLNHKHDLIHKAVGWMLREIGKRDKQSEDDFLYSRYQEMPRTMLRYAIEKHPEQERQKYLKNEI